MCLGVLTYANLNNFWFINGKKENEKKKKKNINQ